MKRIIVIWLDISKKVNNNCYKKSSILYLPTNITKRSTHLFTHLLKILFKLIVSRLKLKRCTRTTRVQKFSFHSLESH